MRLESLEAIGQAGDDLCLGAVLHEKRNAAGMVRFYMAGYDVVNAGRIDDARNAGQHFLAEGFLYRINQGDFFIQDEIGIIGGAATGLVAVEAAHGPVDGPYPVNIGFDFNGLHITTAFR